MQSEFAVKKEALPWCQEHACDVSLRHIVPPVRRGDRTCSSLRGIFLLACYEHRNAWNTRESAGTFFFFHSRERRNGRSRGHRARTQHLVRRAEYPRSEQSRRLVVVVTNRNPTCIPGSRPHRSCHQCNTSWRFILQTARPHNQLPNESCLSFGRRMSAGVCCARRQVTW